MDLPRHFAGVNWRGLYTLCLKETLRFFDSWMQTILGPAITSLLFLAVFIFLVFKQPIDLAEIGNTLVWISAFLALEVVGDWLLLRPMTLAASEGYLKHSMGRVVVLFLSVFIGSFLAFFSNGYFVIPFIILKTLTDIAVVIENFRMPFRRA